MNKAYLLVYSNALGTREQVRTIVDSIPQIVNWRYEMPHSFYLVSSETAEFLCDRIKEKADKPSPVFLITEISGNRQGWLNPISWNFMKDRKSV